MARRTQVAKAAQQSVTVFPGRKPDIVLGLDDFARHQNYGTWDDEGVAESFVAEDKAALMQSLQDVLDAYSKAHIEDIKAYGSIQVRDALVDYMKDAYLDVGVVDGRQAYVLEIASASDLGFKVVWFADEVIADAMASDQAANDRALEEAIMEHINNLRGQTGAPDVAEPTRPALPDTSKLPRRDRKPVISQTRKLSNR